jgi:predicted dehydrogenase
MLGDGDYSCHVGYTKNFIWKFLTEKMAYKVVFWGLGSIGSRLARLTKENFGHELYAFRSVKKRPNNLGIEEIHSLDELKFLAPDIIFITNPTSEHFQSAMEAASLGAHLFIEKPLSHTLKGIRPLLRQIQNSSLISFVGCNLRFDPIVRFLRRCVDIRKFSYANVVCSSYLPDWRPNIDYRESYSARKSGGGGVLLDLIHEPDYCYWLFGPIKSVEGVAGRCSHLEIETEDFADITITHNSGFQSNIHLDYFGETKKREIEIAGSDSCIKADLVNRTVTHISNGECKTRVFGKLGSDYTYLREIAYFFNCINLSQQPMNSIEEHSQVLVPILEFKRRLGLDESVVQQ